MVPTENLAKKEFETSLKRTGAGYFDYYLLHNLLENNYQKYGNDRPGKAQTTPLVMTQQI